MSKMGRPKKEINQKEFEALCKIQCTEEEILDVLDIADKTLNNWCKKTYGKTFYEVFKQKRMGGKASLRRNQWKLSETNPSMAIFLGKQYLGQSDKVEETVSFEDLTPLGKMLSIDDEELTNAENSGAND